jgi:nucleotide-binding universal stress UspA family protein
MPVTILKLDADLRESSSAGEKAVEREKQENASHEKREQRDADSEEKELSGARSINESAAEQRSDPVANEVKTGAKASAAKVIKDEAEPDPEKVHLITKVPLDRPADVVRDEARKGYDLLFIGMEDFHDPDGNIAPKIAELASGFEGPLALLSYRGDRPVPLTSRTHLLVPVNGSPSSRRAAEVAFLLARATGARVTALFVSQTDGRSRTRSREEGVLKNMTDLAERYDVRLATRISKRSGAAEAILKEAKGGYSMIVMGVAPRPGDDLFFGNTAATLLRDWENPLLLLAS